MNKILISFLSLVMFINPNIGYSAYEDSYSSETDSSYEHEAEANTANYTLPNRAGYINALENLQARIDNIYDLNIDTPRISRKIDVLKERLERNDDFLFDGFEVNYIRNRVLPELNFSLNRAQQENKQEKAQIVAELIGIYSSVANDIEHLENQ